MNYTKVLSYTMAAGATVLCGYLIKDGITTNNPAELTAGAVNTVFAGMAGYICVKEDVKEAVKKMFSHKDKSKDITDKF